MTSEPRAGFDLEAANDVFHETYANARDVISHEIPIFILLPDELVVYASGDRRSYGYRGSSFDAAKTGAHVAVALFTLSCGEAWDEAHEARLQALIKHSRAAADPKNRSGNERIARELSSLLQACSSFAELLGRDRSRAASERAFFARDAGQRILQLTQLATREQVDSLHQAVEAAVAQLSRHARSKFEVVVVGDHQARARSLGMQYFQRRLGEAAGLDERVTYGENISKEAEALALIGTRRLDRTIALAFFGDERRLQRDVLGDAAKACLDDLPIGPESRG